MPRMLGVNETVFNTSPNSLRINNLLQIPNKIFLLSSVIAIASGSNVDR